jgi:hypothetical protein
MSTATNLECVSQQRNIHPAAQECIMPSPIFRRAFNSGACPFQSLTWHGYGAMALLSAERGARSEEEQ